MKHFATLLLSALFLLLTGIAEAATVVNNPPSTPGGVTHTVGGIIDFQPAGNAQAIAGLQVQVTGEFNNNPFTETILWRTKSGNMNDPAGIAQGTNWSLAETGDSFFADWTFDITHTKLEISQIKLIGFNGASEDTGVVFDIWDELFGSNRVKGTPDSQFGHVFKLKPGSVLPSNMMISPVYTDPIMLVGSAGPVGDLFRIATYNFSSPLNFSHTLVFEQDTDIATLNSSPGPVIPAPPALPAGIILLLGYVIMQRRSKRLRAAHALA